MASNVKPISKPPLIKIYEENCIAWDKIYGLARLRAQKVHRINMFKTVYQKDNNKIFKI